MLVVAVSGYNRIEHAEIRPMNIRTVLSIVTWYFVPAAALVIVEAIEFPVNELTDPPCVCVHHGAGGAGE